MGFAKKTCFIYIRFQSLKNVDYLIFFEHLAVLPAIVGALPTHAVEHIRFLL